MTEKPMTRPARLLLVSAVSVSLVGAPVLAQDDDAGDGWTEDGWEEEASDPRAVDLELVLAVDISRSMDYDEQLIQRDGYVAAFRDESVVSALTGGYHGRVAVTYMEWANEYSQKQTVPWTVIETAEDAAAFAAAMEAAPIISARGTSISGALQAAAGLINSNDYDGVRRVIDISGDGSNRDGIAVEPVRDAVVASGVIINGLPLMLRPSGGFGGGGFGGGGFGGGGGYGRGYGFEEVGDLEAYYRDHVVGGSGAFVLPVRSVDELPGSIRQKLILEIVGEPTLGPRAELEVEADTALE
jgi:hypothetical protein